MVAPAPIPNHPIYSAITSNFSSKGVLLFSWALSTVLLIIPFWLWSPTAKTIAYPVPSIHLLPLIIKGEGTLLLLLFSIISRHLSYFSFFKASLSPVNELSSIFIPFPSISNKSAGKISPIIILIKSPTKISSLTISTGIPFLIILYAVPLFFIEFNSWNLVSLL